MKMSEDLRILDDPRIQAAAKELQESILQGYPDATFALTVGDDPVGVYLHATVDIEDTDEVIDLIIDRMLELQIEEELPIYVIPVRPIERVLAMRARDQNPPEALLT